MPRRQRIPFLPGIVKDETHVDSRPYWTDGDKVRFTHHNPTPIGGWTKFHDTALTGVCRGMLSWQDSDEIKRLALGTHKKLYHLSQDTLTNITPYRATGNLTDPFTTVSGSPVVTVTHTAHGGLVGSTVNFTGASAVGGITISGDYLIESMTVDAYTIRHSSNASSSASGGGTVAYKYEINVGTADATLALGYGVGTYSGGTYGTPRASSSVTLAPRTWSLATRGDNLVACPRGGNIYRWTLNTSSRAAIISGAPTNNAGLFTTKDGFVVVYGAGGDPRKIQWPDQDDETEWSVSDTTAAGSRILSASGAFIAGMPAARTNLLFTNKTVWTMTLIGGDDVFAFDEISKAAGIMGPKAGAAFEGMAFWMGDGDFYRYDGVVRVMPHVEDIRQFVFKNLNRDQREKIVCGINSQFREVWWFYPSEDSSEVDRYVAYMIDSQKWITGTLERTAWLDKSDYSNPLAVDADGYVYAHEDGTDADGEPLEPYVTSSPVLLGDGSVTYEITAIASDVQDLEGSVTLTLMCRDNPQDSDEEVEAGTITTSVKKLDPRASARQLRFKYASEDLGDDWRLGAVLVEMQPLADR